MSSAIEEVNDEQFVTEIFMLVALFNLLPSMHFRSLPFPPFFFFFLLLQHSAGQQQQQQKAF